MTVRNDLFAGGGETGRLMAQLDWAATDLGPVRQWSQSLRAAVRIVLSSRYPMLLLWGPNLTQLYNDAYSALIGDKHPAALGLDVRITLAEGWDVLRPLLEEAMATGVASWVPALRLLLDRAGYREEAYFSVSHAAARDDDGTTVGVLTVCSEVTEQVVGERRLRLLRDLALPGGTGPVDVRRTCTQLCDVIGEHPLDVPFAAIYLREGRMLRRYATVGAAEPALPAVIPLDGSDDFWKLRTAAEGGTAQVEHLQERLWLPGGPWQDPVRTAVAQPLPSADLSQPTGVLLTGLSPSRAPDETYRSFLQLLAQQVAVAVRNAQAFEEERARAAALAELDRAKTEFFTNVSHEFRTPLSLMLGPLSDALADRAEPLAEQQRVRVDTARRNADRLLTLVNELLTFSSIESRTARVVPRTLDLARFTAELAGVFRAAIERTGLRLVVECPPLPRPVAVDPDHWEKIVTNLLSNALKFSFVGQIRVSLESDDTAVRLRVSDTGIGIDAAELPHLFDRFHRVQGARSRSHEGTGIGLALVRELSRLQGGDVEVSSVPGEGTTFTVVLPWSAVEHTGAPALEPSPDRLAGARAAATESAGWIDPADEVPGRAAEPTEPGAPRILVADDNRDMRDYLSRLLSAEGWRVETVADGETALRTIRLDRPDLLITDVMMPRLDGFGLIRALRSDQATRSLPVLVLSARAGQESSVEGLAAGADDYVVKPFSAAQLIARVRGILALARLRAVPAQHRSAPTGTAELIASARVVEEVFQAVTDQTRALLDGVSAVTTLTGDGSRPPLTFRSTSTGRDGEPTGTAEADIRGRDGLPVGTIAVRTGLPAERAGRLLVPPADLLGYLTGSGWQPDQQRQAAVALQYRQLPDSVPSPEGWQLSPAYRPAPTERCGNAWYDVFEAPGGRLVVAVGDMTGHGLAAAAGSGLIRHAVRTYAADGAGPAEIITRTAATVSNGPFSAGLLVASIEPHSGALLWCGAGRVVSLLSVAGAQTRSLTGPVGPLLGSAGATYQQHEDVLAPGDQLLISTDGIATDGDALRRRCHAEFAAGATATTLVETLLADAPQPQRDDVAIVAVRRQPATVAAAVLPPVDVTWAYPLDPTASAVARRDLKDALHDQPIDPDLLYDLQVAATEAINNSVEHAQNPSRPEVLMRLQVTDGVIRVEVQDFGGWRARPPARDRGRGAILMNASADVRMVTTPTGTRVTIEHRWTG